MRQIGRLASRAGSLEAGGHARLRRRALCPPELLPRPAAPRRAAADTLLLLLRQEINPRLDVRLEVALEAGEQDLAVTGLEAIHDRGDGALQVSTREQDQLLHSIAGHTGVGGDGGGGGSGARVCSQNSRAGLERSARQSCSWCAPTVLQLVHPQRPQARLSARWMREGRPLSLAARPPGRPAPAISHLVHELCVGDGVCRVVEEGPRHVAAQPVLALLHALLAERHLERVAVTIAWG